MEKNKHKFHHAMLIKTLVFSVKPFYPLNVIITILWSGGIQLQAVSIYTRQ